MNHRYAFCGRDNDPDGQGEEQVLGDAPLYTSTHTKHHAETRDNSLCLEETATFLSDSSLDGAPLGFRAGEEDEDEEEEEEETLLSNHAHKRREERRMELEDRRRQSCEESKKKNKKEAEGQDTKNDYHSSNIEVEPDEEQRDIKREMV